MSAPTTPMGVSVEPARSEATPQRRSETRATPGNRWVIGAVSGIGLGVMFIVGRDGTPTWQLMRVLVAGVLTLVVLNVPRRWSARGRLESDSCTVSSR